MISGISCISSAVVSQLEREPDRPGAEFVIAIVGSLTSFAIAVILALAAALFDVPPGARAIIGKSPLGDPDGESGGLGVRVHPDGPK
jgi:hypothetical protein